ncbi:8-amino-7-oxononanoate synthase [uncultured Moraxella sp.]|uniref:aminotransferase class I/II-fold pyridoxal phosphate-dependent enzyme n=1 Tax=uncultured Moraxella sp. TaxID=263769 RepID=UPI0025F3FA03|nr:8-amino-7-oxononanoate synthase [uncultured Moraxella sp.]
MSEQILAHFADKLAGLKQAHNHRSFRQLQHQGTHIHLGGQKLVNLASNDYLGVASDECLQAEFLASQHEYLPLGSSSSRLLTGNFAVYEALEARMSSLFLGRACLLFNSGYHANVGILPAICDARTLILADKLVHASIIDGMRLAAANGTKCVRYQHQNFTQLETLIQKYHDEADIERIVIVTESIFSMDGDVTDLPALVRLKASYPKLMLYIDEAHAIGVCGEQGLGCAEVFGCIDEIDLIVGAFGKAMASVGGYVICHEMIKDYLINAMRPLIFSTALPPLNIAWTAFVLDKIITMQSKRARLKQRYEQLIAHIKSLGLECSSDSQIVPIILKDNERTMCATAQLAEQGFFVLGVRPPTVPQNQSRLRICLNSAISDDEFERFCQVITAFGDGDV